jgi:hypothetical protein
MLPDRSADPHTQTNYGNSPNIFTTGIVSSTKAEDMEHMDDGKSFLIKGETYSVCTEQFPCH